MGNSIPTEYEITSPNGKVINISSISYNNIYSSRVERLKRHWVIGDSFTIKKTLSRGDMIQTVVITKEVDEFGVTVVTSKMFNKLIKSTSKLTH